MKSTDNIPAMRRIWKKCFEADTEFLNLFFGNGPNLCKTYFRQEGNDIASSLSVFPVQYNGHSGGYVYGVCTAPEYRGHSYAVTLLRKAEEDCMHNLGMDFFLLRPASESLFNYYKKQGYSLSIHRGRFCTKLPQIPEQVHFSPITGTDLYFLRKKYYAKTVGIFEWEINTCGYILDYIAYCHGKAAALHSTAVEKETTYFLGYPSADNPQTIICEETGILPDGSNLNTITSAIRLLYPSAINAIINNPYLEQNEDFLLSKCLNENFSIDGNPLFSFTME